MIEHRKSRDESAEQENGYVFPKAFQEFFIREQERREKQDEDERSKAERDVGVQSETENSSGKEKVAETPRPQSAEKEVKREGQEKRRHYGAEADARKIDRPVGGGEHKTGDQARSASFE